MKCVVATMAVCIAFASHAFAVLRPLFPAKAAPPFGGEAIVTGNALVQHPAKQPPGTVPR